MIKIIKKIKNNREGFVILFVVTLSAILLSIALGVENIAQKEVKFGTSAKDTNNAFFAADTGIEQALFNDRSSGSVYAPAPGSWVLTLSGLGSNGTSCAKVTVDKDNSIPAKTVIISKGYNSGDDSCQPLGGNRVERELKVKY
ncbi:hypothetical protein HYW73_01025 [Candidatus Nomurabacteria bacterium]|nr:hypothetical protein [Candidatus Nomurabacteria bacterium]